MLEQWNLKHNLMQIFRYTYDHIMAATTTEGTQPYKYSTKELDRQNGLDLYDSQARLYDSIIPRTTTMDPLAEKYYSLSPYTWCAANPINLIDEKGDSIAVLHKSGIIGHLALLIHISQELHFKLFELTIQMVNYL
ncbi:MAG: RHS repeat domain-containing protein [Sodaliphilus sp.]